MGDRDVATALSTLGSVSNGGPGRQLDIIDRLPLRPKSALERRRFAGKWLVPRVGCGSGVRPEIGEVATDLETPGDLLAERWQRRRWFDIATADAGRRADPAGVVGEPAWARSAEHRTDRLVVPRVVRLDRHDPAGPEQRVYRRQERLADQPPATVDRVGVQDPDAGQLRPAEPASKVLGPTSDEPDVPQPAAHRPGGRRVDRLVRPVDADEPRVGTVSRDVAQQFPVGTTDLAEDPAVEPVAEPPREPIGPGDAERARRSDQVGELGQPVGKPTVAGRGGAVRFRSDRRSVPRPSAGSNSAPARTRALSVGIDGFDGGATKMGWFRPRAPTRSPACHG